MPVNEAVTKIRGPKGTNVVLTLGRLGRDDKGEQTIETIELPITRDTIVVKSVAVSREENGIFLIEIRGFNEDVSEEFTRAVDEALAGSAKGLVIDVRNNPGGYLDKAVAVTG